ncbi:secreted RxLR effector protein 161-like [Juglans microcarpa x Juglans regia]|uniref:secreted RxLR effector protein 161-like n=1 Tax=Juglans microcarpa x Juglans regia TaxID=2249226 RepID=UPI001B7F6D4F|nr:secreted RxLR effector protein 161-like [Juglans microcarpa x Juglans regia]
MAGKKENSECHEELPATTDMQLEVEQSIDSPCNHETQVRKIEDSSSKVRKQGGENTYQLARDRERKVIKPPQRYGQVELTAFALTVAEEVIEMEPKTFKEAMASKEHSKLSITQAPETDEDKEFMKNIPYASIVGSIMYIMVCTRLDLTYAVSIVSRFMSNPGKSHWHALKCVFQYLSSTKCFGLKFGENMQIGSNLQGFVDSDYTENLDTSKSLTGFVFTIFGGAVSWKTNLQPVVALSTTEAEYIAMTEAIKEPI